MTDEERNRLADELYEKYGKPLEEKHWGEFLAVSPKGKTVLAPTMLEALKKAKAALGRGNFLFKVGPRVVGTALWRGSL